MTIQQKDYDPALMQGAANTVALPQTITDATSSALAVGRQGATNPAFLVDAATASCVTGLKITAAATGTAVALAAIGSATDEKLKINAKGAGTITIGDVSTGNIALSSPITYKPVSEVVTATNVITASESGSVFFLNSSTEFVSTLPAPAAGLTFTFIVTAAPSGASYTVVCAAAATLIKGHVLSSQDAGGSSDSGTTGEGTVTFVDSKAVAGDMAEFWCDGTNWFVTGKCKVFDAITIS